MSTLTLVSVPEHGCIGCDRVFSTEYVFAHHVCRGRATTPLTLRTTHLRRLVRLMERRNAWHLAFCRAVTSGHQEATERAETMLSRIDSCIIATNARQTRWETMFSDLYER